MASEIPDNVKQFIARHIDSVSALDVLLLMRAVPGKQWSADEVGRALVTGEEAAMQQLRRLCDHRVLVSEGSNFAYQPGTVDGPTIEQLAECYARRRHTVISLIYGSSSSAVSLADAFRFRGPKT